MLGVSRAAGESRYAVHDDVDLKVEDLMARVRDRVLQHESRNMAQVPEHARTYVYAAELDADSVEALLHTARRLAMVRTDWPRRLWRFPFSASAWLRRTLLRFFAFVFNDQRHVNFSVIEAVREQLQIIKEMQALVAALQGEVRQLEDRVARAEQEDVSH